MVNRKFALFYLLFSLITLCLGFWARRLAFYDLTHFPVDYGNYIRGIQALYQRENPYQNIEFFLPPWAPFLLAPYYLLKNPIVWQLTNIGALIGVFYLTKNILTIQGKPFIITTILFSLLPTTLFVIILGQLSPVIGFMLLYLYWLFIQNKFDPWKIAFALIFISLKPHIVLLPGLLLAAEMIRKKLWKSLIIVMVSTITWAVLSTLAFYPNWLPAFIDSLTISRKYLGGDGLVTNYHASFASIGIPALVFIPLLIYIAIYWFKNGLDWNIYFLSSTLNFLIIPYSRQYDYVILIPVYIYLLEKIRVNRQYLLIIPFLLSIFIIPFFTNLSFILPAIIMIFLLAFKDYKHQPSDPNAV